MTGATGQGRVQYSDFSGGDFGNTDPAQAPLNTFRGMNVLVTADGALVPRPGWKERTPSSMPTGKVVGMTPTATPGSDMMFIVGDKVYTYDLTDLPGGVLEIGTLDTTPTEAVFPKRGTAEYYITVHADKSYLLDPVSNTINPLDGSPGGREIEVYEYRLMVAGADEAWRVQFSDTGDFESWPSENFFDTRDEWQVTAMREQNNHLAILKRVGAYSLTGVPGTTSATLRRVNRGLGPLHPGQVDIDEKDQIHLIQAFHRTPSGFDGVDTEALHFLNTELAPVRDGNTPTLPIVLGVAETLGDRSASTVLVMQGGDANIMLLNHNGAWTRHHIETDISGMVRGGFTGDFYVTDGGDTGVAGKIYSIQFDQNRPTFLSEGLVTLGDGSNTPVDAWVQFPQYWVPAGKPGAGTEISVRQVIVDYEKYRTDASATNHFEIQVDILGRNPAGTLDASPLTYSFDEANAEAGDAQGDYVRDRLTHGFQSARGAGFQVSLNDIRGVKIQQVTVVFDVFANLPSHSG